MLLFSSKALEKDSSILNRKPLKTDYAMIKSRINGYRIELARYQLF